MISRPEVMMSRLEVMTSRPEVMTSRLEVMISRLEVMTSRPEVMTSRPEVLPVWTGLLLCLCRVHGGWRDETDQLLSLTNIFCTSLAATVCLSLGFYLQQGFSLCIWDQKFIGKSPKDFRFLALLKFAQFTATFLTLGTK